MKEWDDYTQEEKDRISARILDSLRRESLIKALSDRELAYRFFDEVLSEIPMDSNRGFIAEQLLTRFEAKCGIKRDEETGEILPE